MKILMVAPEVAPFVKEGGLADVVGALPKALSVAGHDVRIVCPRHGSLKIEENWTRRPEILYVPTGEGTQFASLWQTEINHGAHVPLYFIEYGEYFSRGEIYHGPWGAHGDNDRRFAFFARAALETCHLLDWIPDVVHCHDWTTGLVPVYLNTLYRSGAWSRTASVYTIHNLEHQGNFSPEVLSYTELPDWVFKPDGLESLGRMNWMKGAIYHANKITTVSPTYAEEIRSPEGGFGLDHALRFKGADLVGILNGIDLGAWDPAQDPLLTTKFSAADLAGKDEAKAELQREFGLEVNPHLPVFGVVSRLFHQKGLDLLASVVERMAESGRMQLVVLGSGEQWEEESFSHAAWRHPNCVGTYIGFSEALAHRIIAGSDFFIMPSRFEPCGLGQQYAMRYGTIPVVRRTGGLADTVIPVGQENPTGFLFDEPHPHQLLERLFEAITLWEQAPDEIHRLRVNGMTRDASWDRSAEQYAQVYEWALAARRGN
ncbi:MAG: glycogen synthase GlgA [Puniceicoccales bacterium]